MLSVEELRRQLNYDPDTGVFRWNVAKRGTAPGSIAGTLNNHGYICIGINYKLYTAHRLAWLWVHGCWPKIEIDHINRIRSDNRLANLREATRRQNKGNCPLRRNNTSGVRGVHWAKARNKFVAFIHIDGETKNLGYYDSLELAQAAYNKVAKQHFGEFLC